jgi:NADPH2:quinone reductase
MTRYSDARGVLMQAYLLTAAGPLLSELPAPVPRPHEVLVHVRAVALNRVDLAMAAGHVHGSAGGLGNVLGLELAGEVIQCGAEVSGLEPGARVMCSGAGAFAQLAAVDAQRVLAIPAGMEWEQAAALPVALQTMHDALATQGALQSRQSVLIQGASSAVGLMGLQLAKLLGARCVAGSSGDPQRRAQLARFGANLAVDWRDPAWVQQVLDATEGAGVDVLIDQISGSLLNQNLRATRIAGRIVNVGRLGGQRGDIDFDLHALRRIQYLGVTFRTRSRAEVCAIVARVRSELSTPLAQGLLNMPIDRVFAWPELLAALAYMRTNQHLGKIVLRM